jgi:hypothetical protein
MDRRRRGQLDVCVLTLRIPGGILKTLAISAFLLFLRGAQAQAQAQSPTPLPFPPSGTPKLYQSSLGLTGASIFEEVTVPPSLCPSATVSTSMAPCVVRSPGGTLTLMTPPPAPIAPKSATTLTLIQSATDQWTWCVQGVPASGHPAYYPAVLFEVHQITDTTSTPTRTWVFNVVADIQPGPTPGNGGTTSQQFPMWWPGTAACPGGNAGVQYAPSLPAGETRTAVSVRVVY